METLIVIAIGLALYIVFRLWRRHVNEQAVKAEREARRARLMEKYKNEQDVEAIMNGEVWEGMQIDQLIESLGEPEDTATKVLKTKRISTYKYDRAGKNRYGMRVTIENGVVVGWDKKQFD